MRPDKGRLDVIALLEPYVAFSWPSTTLKGLLVALECPVSVSPNEGGIGGLSFVAFLQPNVALPRPATTLEDLIVALEGPVAMGPNKCGLDGIVLTRK